MTKQNGTWTALDKEENLILPKGFEDYLNRAPIWQELELKGRTLKGVF
jgi:uncharacterized protein YdeI (YjbR/CyaY-like superfamily)